jgi:hypothetical protein
MTILPPRRLFGSSEEVQVFTDFRLLIVEDETLIALDIQRVVARANAKNTVFARNFKEFSEQPQIGRFDLAIVNPPRPGTPDGRVFDQLAVAGTAIVICTAALLPQVSGDPPNHETVAKPFSDGELLAACARALARARLSFSPKGQEEGPHL